MLCQESDFFAKKTTQDLAGASPAVCTLPMVPCSSSPVTRVSRSPLPCEKRSARGGGSHYPSLHITIHHYPSLHITTHHYPSLHTTIHHYSSLSITNTSLSTSTHHYPLLHIIVRPYTSLSITTHHYHTPLSRGNGGNRCPPS